MKDKRRASSIRARLLDLVLMACSALILLACSVVELIDVSRDGSGVWRGEITLEAHETGMLDQVRQGLQERMSKDPKLRIAREGPRGGGYFFTLERPFRSVSEINDDGSTYRWSVIQNGGAEDTGSASDFGSLFATRFRLDMNFRARDIGAPPPSLHRVEVKMPGRVVETNGERIEGGKVAWNRLAAEGRNSNFVVSKAFRIPAPSELADWFVARHRSHYFDEDGLVWLGPRKVWVGSINGEPPRGIAVLENFDSLEAGGNRLLLYRREEWWSGVPQNALVMTLGGSPDSLELRDVVAPRLSPDGRYLSFGRSSDTALSHWKDPANAPDSEGLMLLDLTSGEERLVAGKLDLPPQRTWRDPLASADPGHWKEDRSTWSPDGTRLFLERRFKGYAWALYSASLKSQAWKALALDRQVDVSVVSAHADRAFVNRRRETDPFYDVCDLATARCSRGLVPAWITLVRNRAILGGAFSKSGLFALAAAPRSEAGWPVPPVEVWVGDLAPRKLITLPPEVGIAYALNWHPNKPLLLAGNALVSTDSGATRVMSPDWRNPQWIAVPRHVFPSLSATRALIMTSYWASLAVLAGLLWLVARAVLPRSPRRPRIEHSRTAACKRCGHPIGGSDRFCIHCGSALQH